MSKTFKEFNESRTYLLDGEDMQKLSRIHKRLADESKPLDIDERRDLHLLMGLLLDNAVEDSIW